MLDILNNNKEVNPMDIISRKNKIIALAAATVEPYLAPWLSVVCLFL